MSISTWFAFVFLLAVGLVAGAFYLILDRIYLNHLKSVADNVDAFGIVGAFVIAMLSVRFAIVNPVERLTKATHQISLAQAADLGVAGIGRNSRNELHQLAIAICAEASTSPCGS